MRNIEPLAYIEISKSNLIHNIRQFKSLAKKGTKFSVAIKGNAYGHGQNEVVKILEPYVDYFQINSISELRFLRRVSRKKVFLFGYVDKQDLKEAIKLGCILAVFSKEQLLTLNQVACGMGIRQEIHIPFDARLGREGFLLHDLPDLFKELIKCKFIKVSGIYSHFANIEDTLNFIHAQKQIDEYGKCLKLAVKSGFKNLKTHISATSGLLAYEKNSGVHPIIRLGIGVYGMWPSAHLKSMYKRSSVKLKPVLSWKTKVAQVKVLQKGSTIGYGLTYRTKKETKIALIPQGYADGLDRGLSNNGEVLIGGTRCNIIGRISMNMFVADVNHLPVVKVEDEVVILGKQGKETIRAEELASQIDTINYEITTRISSLLPRVIN